MRRVLSIETEIASLHKSFSSSDFTNDQYPHRCHHLFFLNQTSQREVVTFLVMHNVFNLQFAHRFLVHMTHSQMLGKFEYTLPAKF